MGNVSRQCLPISNRLVIPGTDIVVQIDLINDQLSMTVNKAEASVYRVILEQATTPIENVWLADMFMRDDRVHLGMLSDDVADYVGTLNDAQG
jgi:hypothetical protein